MGAIDKLEPHQSILCVKDMRVDLFQFIPTNVIITIASGPCKIALSHPVRLKSIQNLLCVGLGNCVYVCKLGLEIGLRPFGKLPCLFAYL